MKYGQAIARSVTIVAMCLGIAACGGGKTTSKSVTTNSVVSQDTAAAQAIVQGCITKGDVLTKAGRTSILTCIAPPGHLPGFESCAQSHVASDGVITKAQRTKYEQDLAVCLEANR